jgi:hypothetical protein
MTVTLLALTATLTPQASAVAPDPGAHQGHAHGVEQGVEPTRIRRVTAIGQAVLSQSAEWTRWTATHGAWSVRFDEGTGTPHRFWGEGIKVDDSSVDTVVSAIDALIDDHADLFGVVGSKGLEITSAAYDPDFDTWYVEYAAARHGIPIWRGGLTFRVKHGNLVLGGADTYPETPLAGAFTIGASRAIEQAIATGPLPEARHTDRSARPLWLPRDEDGVLVLRAVWEVRTTTHPDTGARPSERGDWVTFIDAETGDRIAHYNEVRFHQGTVLAEHDIRSPGMGLEVSPVRDAIVTNGNESVFTDANGFFTIGDAPSYETSFAGDPVFLQNLQGDDVLGFTGDQPMWSEANGDLAAIDAYVHTHRVRDAFRPVAPDVFWSSGETQVFVNLNDACNAYFDGTINFFQAGAGCQNTARLADVVYHEWGHGLHAWSLLAGSFDGALSEGVGDTVSFLMTGDPNLAPGFFMNSGAGYLRTADNTRFYPDDITGQVHEDGLIFAGAMYDTYLNIQDSDTGQDATLTTMSILAGLLKAGPGLEDAMEEALVADDDDGNLANGTPNECAIVQGFSAHGLGALGSSTGFVVGHEPIAMVADDDALSVRFQIVGPASCAADFGGGDATVTWRADGGEWQDTPLDFNDLDAEGAIPSQPRGTFIEYYVTVEGEDTLSAPARAWRNPFAFYVGDVVPVHCDDFEDDDGGYTHELLGGQPGDGADDWQHGRPRGLSGDPGAAFSGNRVWGNDLGGDNFNGAYQDSKHNRLTSPVWDLKHYDGSFLQYRRWLNVEDGVYDQASILANGEVVWSNFASNGNHGEEHHGDTQWAPHAVDLGDVSGELQIAFDLQSDGGLAFGGWTIDDVCVMAPATVNNRLGVSDFKASEGDARFVTLTWTNPVHEPLAEVRVVRTKGPCPTSVDDGEVVFYDNDPEPGAEMVVEDPLRSTADHCYAVFPGDGTDFLGFADFDFNVDAGNVSSKASRDDVQDAYDANGLAAFEDEVGPIKGCGCSSASGAGWFAMLLAPLALLARRRR